MTEHVALVVNPTATRATTRLIDDVHDALVVSGEVIVHTTERHGHAGELARTARDAGATVIAVIGGDGTVGEAAAALAGSDTALLPVAAGSTNVFTRSLGWPHPGQNAIPLIRRVMGAVRRREVPLGRFITAQTDRTFLVNAGFGIDAETVQIIESRPWIKHHFRQAGFGAVALLGAIRASRPAGAVVTLDDGESDTFASLMVVTGSPYAYVGSRPLDLVPGATFDGRLRWLGIHRHRADIIAAVLNGAVHADGRHLGSRGVRDGWAREITVQAEQPIAFQADGEPLGWHREAHIGIGPTLTVVAPPDTEGEITTSG